MSARKIIASLVGIAAVVAGAVAVARSSADTNISTFPKTRELAAACPKIDWPYGCEWRPAALDLGKKKSSLRSTSSRRSNTQKLFSQFGLRL